MATYDLVNEQGLGNLLASGGIDSSVRTSIINYLMADGLLTGSGDKVAVQEDKPLGNYPPLNANTEVLYLTSPSDFVTTDPSLKVIVDTGDAYLTVAGSDNVLVVAGNGVNQIDMAGTSGNDVVMAEAGKTIGGGEGHGSHGHHNLLGGGNDGWPAGGHSGDHLWSDGGNYSTLGGGGGNDGSHDPHGTPTTITAGTGNDTLISGSENTLFEVGRQGNDVIEGGGGHDAVQFDDSLANATIHTTGGVTTVDFKDTGQTITMTGVRELEFEGHHDVTIK